MLANAMAAVFVMYDPLVGHEVLIGDGLSKWVKLEVVVGAMPLVRKAVCPMSIIGAAIAWTMSFAIPFSDGVT
jgi:hypothetical protein